MSMESTIYYTPPHILWPSRGSKQLGGGYNHTGSEKWTGYGGKDHRGGGGEVLSGGEDSDHHGRGWPTEQLRGTSGASEQQDQCSVDVRVLYLEVE